MTGTTSEEMPDLRAVSYTVDERIAIITLDRPHRNNAWTGTMDREYRFCLDLAESDPSVSAIVVTGAGERFCVGGDSQALEGHVERGGYDTGLVGDEATPGYGVEPIFDHPFACHFGLSKPVIAAVNGAAAGIGMALAMFADLRFATPGAKFTTAHGKLGLPPEYGLSWLLPRMVGLPRALDVLLTSRVLLAEEALEWGLINGIRPPDELLAFSVDYAKQLVASVAGGSLRASRQQVYRDLHGDIGTSVVDSMRLLNEMMGGDEYREGVAALVEKRPPRF
ncbi:MAG: enoyl-CoA hydratase-related protein [Acidimicrobiales bacterium]